MNFQTRYLASIPHIADQYYPENLLIVTHQNGVEQAITLALGSEALYEVGLELDINDKVPVTHCNYFV